MFGDPRPAQNPYVFVVGCPRSGTTLLQRMLDNHPDLAVANDSHFIPVPLRDLPVGTDPVLTSELVESVRTYRRFYRLSLSDDQVDAAAAGASRYSEFVAGLYTAYAHNHGKDLAGEKTPDYVKHLPRLHLLFPSARAVHIIRDGRDVALSAMDWAHDGKGPSKLELWSTEPVAVCALWWRWMVTLGMREGTDLGPSIYREVRYEELVTEPEPVLRGLAQHLGLPDSPDMANFHVGKTKANPRLSAKSAWLPATPGLRTWRETLSRREQSLFELLAGDLLAELGYELAWHRVSQEVARAARQARDWWESRDLSRFSSRADVARGMASSLR